MTRPITPPRLQRQYMITSEWDGHTTPRAITIAAHAAAQALNQRDLHALIDSLVQAYASMFGCTYNPEQQGGSTSQHDQDGEGSTPRS